MQNGDCALKFCPFPSPSERRQLFLNTVARYREVVMLDVIRPIRALHRCKLCKYRSNVVSSTRYEKIVETTM